MFVVVSLLSVCSILQVQAQLPSRQNAAALILTTGAAWAAITFSAGAADLSAGEEVFTNNCGNFQDPIYLFQTGGPTDHKFNQVIRAAHLCVLV